jgi:hypothetical protein
MKCPYCGEEYNPDSTLEHTCNTFLSANYCASCEALKKDFEILNNTYIACCNGRNELRKENAELKKELEEYKEGNECQFKEILRLEQENTEMKEAIKLCRELTDCSINCHPCKLIEIYEKYIKPDMKDTDKEEAEKWWNNIKDIKCVEEKLTNEVMKEHETLTGKEIIILRKVEGLIPTIKEIMAIVKEER